MTDPDPCQDAELVIDRRGGVLVLRLNRPEARNALTPELTVALGEALVEAEEDDEIRVVVLTGTGDRAFCAGMDLRSFSEGKAVGVGDDPGTKAFLALMRGEIEVPLVGAAQATAFAGGLELLLGCDVIVAADDARFGLPEVKRGLFPGGGGTNISQRIAMHVALELVMTGDPIDAQRAYELGLVNHLAPAGEVLDRAVAIAERIAANAPLGVAAVKELTRLAVTDPEEATQRQREWTRRVFRSEDAKEGALAFVEKRDPVWVGR